MNLSSRNLNLFSLAGRARILLEDSRTAASLPMRNLKSQLDDLWSMAEEVLPRSLPADLVGHVERTLEDLRAWRGIGLTGQFAT